MGRELKKYVVNLELHWNAQNDAQAVFGADDFAKSIAKAYKNNCRVTKIAVRDVDTIGSRTVNLNQF